MANISISTGKNIALYDQINALQAQVDTLQQEVSTLQDDLRTSEQEKQELTEQHEQEITNILETYGSSDNLIDPESTYTFGTVNGLTQAMLDTIETFTDNKTAFIDKRFVAKKIYCHNIKQTAGRFVENPVIEQVYAKKLQSVGGTFASNCPALTSINFPALQSVGGTFASNCNALTSINLPALQSVGGNVVYNCPALTSINLPALQSINGQFTSNCPAIQRIHIGGGQRMHVVNDSCIMFDTKYLMDFTVGEDFGLSINMMSNAALTPEAVFRDIIAHLCDYTQEDGYNPEDGTYTNPETGALMTPTIHIGTLIRLLTDEQRKFATDRGWTLA